MSLRSAIQSHISGKRNNNMKLTAKSLKTLSVIFLGLALFGIGYTVVYEWRSDNTHFYSGLSITLALVSSALGSFFGIAAKRKKDQESKDV